MWVSKRKGLSRSINTQSTPVHVAVLSDPKVLTDLGQTGQSFCKIGQEFLEGGERGEAISLFLLTQKLRLCLDEGNVGPCCLYEQPLLCMDRQCPSWAAALLWGI